MSNKVNWQSLRPGSMSMLVPACGDAAEHADDVKGAGINDGKLPYWTGSRRRIARAYCIHESTIVQVLRYAKPLALEK